MSRAALFLCFASLLAVAVARPLLGADPDGAVALIVFNSGVDPGHGLLPDGATDPHYRLVQSPDPAFPGPEARVAAISGWPYPQWVENGPDSKWISPRVDVAEGNNSGTYIYRTTVDLTGLDPATAVVNGRWATDNDGLDILLNGLSTGNQVLLGFNFGAFAPFTITNGFVPGSNTLDFVVHQAGAATPTGLRVEWEGTARRLCVDCPPPGSPSVVLTSPTDHTIMCPVTNLAVRVEAAAVVGSITRVELYAGTALIGTRTNAPYDFTASPLNVGDYVLTARAIDTQGQSAVSAPVHITLTEACPDRIGIIASPDDPQRAPLEAVLFEMGLAVSFFEPAHLDLESLRACRALVWLTGAASVPVLTDDTRALLQQAAAEGVSLYFAGEGLAVAVAELDEPRRAAWTQLLHIEPRSAPPRTAMVQLAREEGHPIIQGMLGEGAVEDFTCRLAVAGATGPGAQTLAVGGDSAVLAAFPATDDSMAGPARIVTQLFDAWSGADEASARERRKLFENAIHWLLGWRPCSLYSLSLEMDAPVSVPVGASFAYTLRVQHQGECEATGVVVTNELPSQVQFLRAEFTQGSVERQGRVVTFRVGHLGSASTAVLKINAVALESGAATQCAVAHGHGEPLETGNTACRTVLVTAGADPRPVLDIRALPGGALELQLNGVPGAGYAVQSSTDLQRWTPLTNLVLSAGSIRWTQPVVLSRQFYRAVRLDPP